jgi:hypothetical protein
MVHQNIPAVPEEPLGIPSGSVLTATANVVCIHMFINIIYSSVVCSMESLRK